MTSTHHEPKASAPPSAPPKDHEFRNGFITGIILGFGPQVFFGLRLLMFGYHPSGAEIDLGAAGDMFGADLLGLLIAIVGVAVGSIIRGRGKGWAFLGGGCAGIGLAMLLAVPTCFGINAMVHK